MPGKDAGGTKTLRLYAQHGEDSGFDIAIGMLRDGANIIVTNMDATARKRTHALLQRTHRFLSGAAVPEGEVGVNQLVSAAVDLVNSVAIAHGVHIEHSLDSRDPKVFGNARQLREMSMALILHVVTMTLNGDPDHRGIRISTLGTANTVAICVKNECPESFGVGLGMPLVRRIVEAHGGSLKVHHRGDRGFNIQITLPGLRRKSNRLRLEPAVG